MKQKIFYLLSVFFIIITAIACTSKTQKAKLIAEAMAKNEAIKNATLPHPETIILDNNPEIIDLTPEQKINNTEIIKKAEESQNKEIPNTKGSLIQVEGLVLKEVSELNIKLNTSGSQIDQIIAMKEYVFDNWHYIYDPETGGDTWRSAEATLSLKYNGQYSGDCDDFAILMASFARQIGLKSRMIGGYERNGNGHAFAEFLIPTYEINNNKLYGKDFRNTNDGMWVSLDWFKGTEHEKYTRNIRIFDDI